MSMAEILQLNSVSSNLTLICGFLLFIFAIWPVKRPKNYPPGPPTLGILANSISLLLTNPFFGLKNFFKYVTSFGKVAAFQFGVHKGIMINDINVLRETFSNATVCSRPNFDVLRHDSRELKGIIFRTGPEWREIRGFTLKTLKNFGMRKATIEPMLVREANEVVGKLAEVAKSGAPLCTAKFFDISVFNVLWELISSTRNSVDDPQTLKIVDFFEIFNNSSYYITVMFMYPWLSKIFWALPTDLKRARNSATAFFDNYVRNRRLLFEETSHGEQPRELKDFTAAFLDKIQTTTESNDTSSIFYGENGYEELSGALRDIHIAGMETTAGTLSWIFLLLALHPEKQKKLQDDIDQVLEGRTVTLADRILLPYVDAVINEALRKSSIAGVGISHCTSEPIKIAGYDIPKGVVVNPSVYSIHHDPAIWGDPENFRPERFLTPENTVIKHEALIPFGIGKRSCPGELFARDELFIFVASIFAKFTIKLNPKEPRPTMDSKTGMALKPYPHTVIVQQRGVQAA